MVVRVYDSVALAARDQPAIERGRQHKRQCNVADAATDHEVALPVGDCGALPARTPKSQSCSAFFDQAKRTSSPGHEVRCRFTTVRLRCSVPGLQPNWAR